MWDKQTRPLLSYFQGDKTLTLYSAHVSCECVCICGHPGCQFMMCEHDVFIFGESAFCCFPFADWCIRPNFLIPWVGFGSLGVLGVRLFHCVCGDLVIWGVWFWRFPPCWIGCLTIWGGFLWILPVLSWCGWSHLWRLWMKMHLACSRWEACPLPQFFQGSEEDVV